MILNEFIEVKLGVIFKDEYNALAVDEILKNKDSYPLIYEYILNSVDGEPDGKKWNFESGFFDCDDDEFCAGYEETMELYRAFMRAFAKDMANKDFTISEATFGVDYFLSPTVHNVLDPGYNDWGSAIISVSPNYITLKKEMRYSATTIAEYFQTASQETYSRTYYTGMKESEDTLQRLTDGFKTLCKDDLLLANRFESKDLKERGVMLENRRIGYPCDCYEVQVDGNSIRFFTTERGFDSLSALRLPILDALTDEIKKNPVAKEIIK